MVATMSFASSDCFAAAFLEIDQTFHNNTKKPFPVYAEDCRERSQVEHHIVGKLVDVPVLNIEKPGNNNEMRRTADGEEFRDPLYSAHDDALERPSLHILRTEIEAHFKRILFDSSWYAGQRFCCAYGAHY